MEFVYGSSVQGLDYRKYGLFLYRSVAAEDPHVRHALSHGNFVKRRQQTNDAALHFSTSTPSSALRQVCNLWSAERRHISSYGLGLSLMLQALRQKHPSLMSSAFMSSQTSRSLAVAASIPRSGGTSHHRHQHRQDDITWSTERSDTVAADGAYVLPSRSRRPLVAAQRRETPSSSNNALVRPNSVPLPKRVYVKKADHAVVGDEDQSPPPPLRSVESFHRPANGLSLASASFSRSRGRRLSTAEQERIDSDHLQLVLAAVPNGMNSSTYNLSLKADRILDHLNRRVPSVEAHARQVKR